MTAEYDQLADRDDLLVAKDELEALFDYHQNDTSEENAPTLHGLDTAIAVLGKLTEAKHGVFVRHSTGSVWPLAGVYVVQVPPDVCDEPVRWCYVNQGDADAHAAEETDAWVTFEPISYDLSDPEAQSYITDSGVDLQRVLARANGEDVPEVE